MPPKEGLPKKAMSDTEFIRTLDRNILNGTANEDPSLGKNGSLQAYLTESMNQTGGVDLDHDETKYGKR